MTARSHADAPIRAVARILALVAALGMIARCGSAPPPPEARAGGEAGTPWFEEVGETSGVSFVYRSGHRERFLMPEIMGGGAALFDMDGDGDLDVYLVQGGSLLQAGEPPQTNRLLRNRGDGTFEDITEGSGAGDAGYGMGVASGDYDDDGDPDLYVTNFGPNVLLRNDGGGRFTDVTEAAGVGDDGWGTSATFVDYDRDGDLDLIVLNYLEWSIESELECFSEQGSRDYCSPRNYNAPARDVLYRNDGAGRFSDVTETAGLIDPGTGLGVICADFDRDGLIDIFIANDGMNDRLWINGGRPGWRFEDHALVLGCAVDDNGEPKAGMGVASADVDDDGDPDLLVGNLNRETDSFYLNQNGTYFVDATAAAGLAVASRVYTRFGLSFVDFDNDGRLDLYQANGRVMAQADHHADDPFAEPNLLFRGLDGGRFEEVTPRGGTTVSLIATSRAAAFGDIDNDGGVDVLVVNRDARAHVLRNVVRDRGNWIMFRVVETGGRDAHGAVLTMTIDGRTLTRDVRTGYSYLASNDPRVHVGLGKAAEAIDVGVVWPDGSQERFGRFPAGRIVTLARGAGEAD